MKNRDFNFLKSKISIFFFSFYLYLIFNSLFSDFPFHSLSTSIFYIRYFFFIFGVIIISKSFKNFYKYSFYSVLIPILFISIDVIFQYVFGFNFFGFEMSKYTYLEGRYSGMFRDELILGIYISRLGPLALTLWFLFDKRDSLIKLLFLLLCVLCTLISGERVAIIMSLIPFTLYFFYKGLKISNFLKLLFFIILMAFFIYQNDKIKNRVVNFTNNQINEVNFNILAPSLEHKKIFQNSLEQFKSNPVFGTGPNNFRESCKNYNNGEGCNTHPHNNALQILTELGIVGFSFYLMFIYLVLSKIVNKIKYRQEPEHLFLLIGCLIPIFPILPSLNFFNNYNCIFIFLHISFFCCYITGSYKT